MNVLIMSDFNPKCSGNFIGSLLHLGEKCKKEGITPIFMFPLNADGSEAVWLDYIRHNKIFGEHTVLIYDGSKSNDELTEYLFKIIDEYQIDLIHSHFSAMETVLVWNRELQKRVKILFHDHMDYVAEEPVMPQLKRQIKRSKRYREYGIGVISVMKRKHRGYLFTPKKWYIANAITFERNVEYSESRNEIRKSLQLNDDDILCLFLGWDIYRKGLDVAIKGVLEARKVNEHIKLGVVGFGKNPSEEALKKIKKVVGFDPIQEGIIFVDYFEDMFALHRASDVYISASRTEAFAYGILEAISQNVPVVISDINGTKWAKKYSKCISFKSENSNDLAKAILKVAPLRFADSNYEDIVKKYDIDVWCDKVIAVYRKMTV